MSTTTTIPHVLVIKPLTTLQLDSPVVQQTNKPTETTTRTTSYDRGPPIDVVINTNADNESHSQNRHQYVNAI